METKMTKRDKMLLIILGIILLVFGAVMMPNVGIKDCIASISDSNSAIKVQEMTNQETLAVLTSKNLYGKSAQEVGVAKKSLEDLLLKKKYAALKTRQNSFSESEYNTAREWLFPIQYLNFTSGSTPIFTEVNFVPEGEFSAVQLAIDESLYEVYSLTCSLTVVADNNEVYTFQDKFEYIDEETTRLEQLSILVEVYNILQERGSIELRSWTIEGSSMEFELVLSMPLDDSVAEYAKEIDECHHCGTPYYKANGPKNEEDEVLCKKCEQRLPYVQ